MNEELQAIYNLDHELAHQTEALKEFEVDLRERTEELPAFVELQAARDAVKEARKKLKREMADDGQITAAQDNVSRIRWEVRDLKDTLSFHLLRHYMDTDGSQVPLETDPSHSQEIVIVAKLGRTVKQEIK